MHTNQFSGPMPTFGEFYEAINGRAPFPWQDQLAKQVADDEAWPAEIGIQTGLGKTACLEIAIWWLASQAERLPSDRTAPTRIWWVVNRRLLVDSTADHAEAICKALISPEASDAGVRDIGIVDAIARRLASLSATPEGKPLEVIRLRGGVASTTPTDPSQPTVVLCTLPMFGSRLLFRGYGSWWRPVDAAMAGTDSLVLLDEAHLAPHLQGLIRALADLPGGTSTILNQSRRTSKLVALTATGDPAAVRRFELSQADESNSILRERLDAAKPLQLRVEQSGDAAKHLASATEELLKDASAPACCLVFANSPKTARAAFERIRKRFPDKKADVLLLTGLVREAEAERIRARILDPVHGMAANSTQSGDRSRHFVVVATQTLEVGADIDAEFLVTEACGVRALTQRLGRLNRRGVYAHAKALYVHLPPIRDRGNAETWPIYGREPASVLKTLKTACEGTPGRSANLNPARITRILGLPCEEPGRAPEILPALLWEWTKTTTPPEGEAPVEPYFTGISGPRYSVSLIWRAHVAEDGLRIWPRASDREAVDVPIGDVRQALKGEQLHRIKADGVTMEAIPDTDVRPGDQLVLPSDRGLHDEFGWNPRAVNPVRDMSLRDRGLPFERTAIERLCGRQLDSGLGASIDSVLGLDEDDDALDAVDRIRGVEEVLARLRAVETPYGWESEEWSAYTESLAKDIHEPQKEVARIPVENPEGESYSGAFDESSLGPAEVDLEQHCIAVSVRAKAVAERIGLPEEVCEVVERAGRLHDIGKADRRFQRWLDPDGGSGVLVAKSDAPRHLWETMRVSSGWPRGGRHEALSCRLIGELFNENIEWLDQACKDQIHRDLLLHLVISHHGNGRPLVLPVKDGTMGSVTFKLGGLTVEVSANLAAVDWEQPQRFRRLNAQFGYWGLALLEAILIRSDHAVSAGAGVESGEQE